MGLTEAISGWGSLDGLWLNACFAEVGSLESLTQILSIG